MPSLRSSIEQIKQRARLNKRVLNPLKWLFPLSAERAYESALVKLVQALQKLVEKYVQSQLEKWGKDINQNRPDRADDIADELEAALLKIEQELKSSEEAAAAYSKAIANQVSDYNYAQMQKVIKNAFSVDLYLDQPWLKGAMDLWLKDNVALIKSIGSEHLKEVGGIVRRGMQQGLSYQSISKELNKRYEITKYRAKVIARDQVGKYNGQLAMLRQKEIGITSYTWSTAGDARVRPSHLARSGRTFKWNDPPAGGHPGSEIMCRCTAQPNLKELIDG